MKCSPIRFARAVALLFCLAAVLPANAAEKAASKPALILENLPERQAREAREVYDQTRERFTRLTGHKVGALRVRVTIVERPSGGQASRTLGQVQGVAIQRPRECQIRIGACRRGSFGRVLAHEVTHAFLREAYGQTVNHALSEGFAEYLASLSHPSEVNRDIHAASQQYVSNAKIQPYVEGYRFCLHYAEAPEFRGFLDAQIRQPDLGFNGLMTQWRHHTRGAKP